MEKIKRIGSKLFALMFVAMVAVGNAHASYVPADFDIDASDITKIAAVVVPVLGGLMIWRKVVKTMNRS